MFFCSLKKGPTPKHRMFCFVVIKNTLFKLKKEEERSVWIDGLVCSKSMFESRAEHGHWECRHFDSVSDVIDTDCLKAQPTASVYIPAISLNVRTYASNGLGFKSPATLSRISWQKNGRRFLRVRVREKGNLKPLQVVTGIRCVEFTSVCSTSPLY